MDAPERIWLLPHDGEQRCWCDDPAPDLDMDPSEADEYVRADLLSARDAEIAALRARIAEMDEALREIRAAVADGHSTRLWGVDVEPEAMSVIDDMVGQLNVVRKIARKALEG